MFNYNVEQEAIEHAKEQFPKESVGIVVDDRYIPLDNNHQNPTNDFKVDVGDYLKYGDVQAVIHSHPHLGDIVPRLYPSELDMRTQMSMAVPWGIICCDKERSYPIQWFGDQVPIKEFIARPFIHGIYDCYALIRDYYRKEHNLVIKDYPREWNWWATGNVHMYRDLFFDAGFKEIPLSQIREGDGFLATLGRHALRNNVVNHGGVYIGNDLILHHKSGDYAYDTTRPSSRECIQRYAKYIKYIVRHESMF